MRCARCRALASASSQWPSRVRGRLVATLSVFCVSCSSVCLCLCLGSYVCIRRVRRVCFSLFSLSPFTPTPARYAYLPCLAALQMLVQSHRPVLRFAAVRTVNEIANTHPQLVAGMSSEIEALTSDANRSIATLAVTALLKTGKEYNVEKLLKQITTFLADVPEEFKIVVGMHGLMSFSLFFCLFSLSVTRSVCISPSLSLSFSRSFSFFSLSHSLAPSHALCLCVLGRCAASAVTVSRRVRRAV